MGTVMGQVQKKREGEKYLDFPSVSGLPRHMLNECECVCVWGGLPGAVGRDVILGRSSRLPQLKVGFKGSSAIKKNTELFCFWEDS